MENSNPQMFQKSLGKVIDTQGDIIVGKRVAFVITN